MSSLSKHRSSRKAQNGPGRASSKTTDMSEQNVKHGDDYFLSKETEDEPVQLGALKIALESQKITLLDLKGANANLEKLNSEYRTKQHESKEEIRRLAFERDALQQRVKPYLL